MKGCQIQYQNICRDYKFYIVLIFRKMKIKGTMMKMVMKLVERR